MLAGAPVRAQSAAAADALFKEAVQLAQQGSYAEAVDKFKASYELDPARGTLLGLALAEEKAGKIASAYAHYQELTDAARAANDAKRETAGRDGMARLEARLPRLLVTHDGGLPAGATVELDGRPLVAGALDTPLPVDPGEHTVSARAADGATFSKSVTVEEAKQVRVAIVFGPPPAPSEAAPPPAAPPGAPSSPPPPPSDDSGSGLRTAGLILGGVGVVVTGVGGYFWIRSGQIFSDVEEDCPGRVCPPGKEDDIDDGRSLETTGRAALIAGGVLVAGGVTLFIFGSSSPSEAGSARVRVGPGSIDVRGTF